MAMKPEVKAQWLKDLRSGKFRQGKNLLRRGDEFCCIGVLCERNLAHEKHMYSDGIYEYGRSATCLSQKQEEFLGISLPAAHRIMTFNDVKGWSFEQIADWIEKNIE